MRPPHRLHPIHQLQHTLTGPGRSDDDDVAADGAVDAAAAGRCS